MRRIGLRLSDQIGLEDRRYPPQPACSPSATASWDSRRYRWAWRVGKMKTTSGLLVVLGNQVQFGEHRMVGDIFQIRLSVKPIGRRVGRPPRLFCCLRIIKPLPHLAQRFRALLSFNRGEGNCCHWCPPCRKDGCSAAFVSPQRITVRMTFFEAQSHYARTGASTAIRSICRVRIIGWANSSFVNRQKLRNFLLALSRIKGHNG